jgi:TetR/AcrR family transcriptional regulator, transcriptional repressor for nem operon
MARPREFDEGEVLDAIVSTFWSRGFESTSIQDIVEATGLSRASLYGAFGDKEKLFERAIGRYVEKQGEMVAKAKAGTSPLGALENIFVSWVNNASGKNSPRGCFLLLAGTEKDSESWARDLIREQQKKMESMLVELIEAAQEQGEIDAERDARGMAKLLIVLQQGLATSARAGWGKERLSTVAHQALELLKA